MAQAGTYRIRLDGTFSHSFVIARTVYDDAIGKTIGYFAVQRCGDSTTGCHRPCHLDDGRRLDNGTHHDVSGGWHDACDMRKWIHATLFGMRGLSKVAEVSGRDVKRIEEEMRWRNLYFHKMQDPARFVMNYCGGDDGNGWTNNVSGDIASNGVGLVRAARLLNDPRLKRLAQRQLDWIVGVNPFNASMVEDVGFNQPAQFIAVEFSPPTPRIAGGVINGICGHEDDSPWMNSGSWQTCEYWTPNVCSTMWLMAELQRP